MHVLLTERQLCCYLLTFAEKRCAILMRGISCWTDWETVVLLSSYLCRKASWNTMAEQCMLDGLRNSGVVIFSLVPYSVVEYYGETMHVQLTERQLCCYLFTSAVKRRGILWWSNACWTDWEKVLLLSSHLCHKAPWIAMAEQCMLDGLRGSCVVIFSFVP
jgi:hypothetical protein